MGRRLDRYRARNSCVLRDSRIACSARSSDEAGFARRATERGTTISVPGSVRTPLTPRTLSSNAYWSIVRPSRLQIFHIRVFKKKKDSKKCLLKKFGITHPVDKFTVRLKSASACQPGDGPRGGFTLRSHFRIFSGRYICMFFLNIMIFKSLLNKLVFGGGERRAGRDGRKKRARFR